MNAPTTFPKERSVQRRIKPRDLLRIEPAIVAAYGGGASQDALAKQFGVCPNTVQAVLRRNGARLSSSEIAFRRAAIITSPEVKAKCAQANRRPLVDRYFEKTVRREGCWGWTGARDGHGYPQIYFEGRKRLCSHVSLEIAGQPRPSSDLCALHTCDNPECTNPDHLWWGTRRENTQDSIRKGRFRTRRK